MSKSLTAKGATLPDVPEWKAPFYMGSLLLLCVLKKNAKGEGPRRGDEGTELSSHDAL